MTGKSRKVEETMAELEALGNEKVRARNERNGVAGKQYGLKLTDIRKLAKRLKGEHELGLGLWATGNMDARLLAALLVQPRELAADKVDRMVREADVAQVADWLNAYVVKPHPEQESLRVKWMESGDPLAARAGWYLTGARVARSPEDLDLDALLDRIESELGSAPPMTQWTMNGCLAAIGIHHAELRDRAVAIGEKLGVYRDYPTPRGCTSPFAPAWIDAVVGR